MAFTANRARRGPLLIRAESGKLLLPQDMGAEVENMYLTKEGTLLLPMFRTMEQP